ncbi:Endonuclease/exonuclease/phosphatase protein [Actinidia chinensis var. chinensis]|uniref:Endonuclease/exonuclease/phosphatase protein n=1 Tax=Actinidia chinensis var. chinensis TaxID=1590841 RepID=A0A2R6PH60_ACTCC|nr:Endonuclease/exonuclease/phosphatase protein [Actinidia chinensis var. chinensis]
MVAKGGVQLAIQKEWVPKQPDPFKDNNASAVAISSLTMEIIPVNHEPNKESIPEPNPEPISEVQSLHIELNPNGVLKHLKKIRPVTMGLIETKLSTQSLERLSKNKPCGWKMVDNFNHHPNGRILVIWKEELVTLVILETSDQAIHCQATCKSSGLTFLITFVYAFNTTVGRRSLWENLRRFNSIHHHPWILLGDFNNVLSNGERINGMPVTTYEIREFKECCYDLGLSDLRSTGAFFTWTNNSVWCKLDRVMVNNEWTQRGMLAQAQYDPPGKLSDHSPCLVSFMEEDNRGPVPFKFFNMWVKHDNFQAVVRSSWDLYVEGTTMFRLCKKLKTLKDPLKSLNKLHFSHISTRSAAAEEELQQAQQQLYNNPNDSELQATIPILRAKALKLAEAEMSFCSQIAKAKFLKNTDKGTKFFHNMIKSKRTRNNIPSISLEDGSRSTSSKQVRDAFVQYYRGLLGTKRNCSRLNPDIARNGRILDQSQSLALVLPTFGKQIWVNIKSWMGISRAMQSLKAMVKWLIKEARGTRFPAKIKRIGIACMVYSTWEARNKRIFEGKVEQPDAISRRIQVQSYKILYSMFPDLSP